MKKKKTNYLICTLILLFAAFTGKAIPQAGSYYNAINPSSPTFVTDLKARVRSPYTRVSYNNFDETNVANFASFAYPGGGRAVYCVYSNYLYVYSGVFGWGKMSREHTWCHSWMPTNPAESYEEYSDQHHLFPTHQDSANGVRSNHPLGMVSTVLQTFIEGKYGRDAQGNLVYEPRNEQKGNSARALLYMTLKYDDINGNDWDFNWLNNVRLPSINEGPQSLELLLQWNKQDPPDEAEVSRNNYIQSIQGNRNPFVDHPEYADHINFYTMTYKSDTPLADEPSNHLTGFMVQSVTENSIALSWTDALAGLQSPQGYLLLANRTGSFQTPTDGASVSADNDLSDGSAAVYIDYSAANTASFSGLTPGTAYYFKMYSFNGDNSACNYKTDGTVPYLTCSTAGTSSGMTDLIISEYVEGSSNNKYLEISNYTGGTVSLSGYSVRVYANGSTTPTNIALNSVSLASGATYVIANSSASAWTGTPQQSTGSLNFNGDDAVALAKNGVNIDIIGKIGEDPGTQWGTGAVATLDHTLRRKASVTHGDNNGSDAFDPAAEWDGFSIDNVSGLGQHTPLPVELVSFSASAGEGQVTLRWRTATEINNYGFEVMRTEASHSGISSVNWQTAGFVRGSGTSNTEHTYSFTDRPERAGRYAYRLKQIDNDGTFSYSESSAVEFSMPEGYYLAQNFPNPFNPSTDISYGMAKDGVVSLKVYDVTGRLISTVDEGYRAAGNHRVSFDAAGLSSGVYFCRLSVNGYFSVKKMVLGR